MSSFLFSNSGNLWIGLTQSGETRDTLNVLEIINQFGLDRLVLTNTAHSSAASLAEPILLECGPECGVAATKTFTIRKMSGDVGVQRVFPMNLPALQKIEIDRRGKVRRARIYYFKNLRGKKARIKDASYKK